MKMKQMIAAIGLAAVASAAMADNQTFDFGNVGDSPGGTYFNSSFVTHLVGDFMDILTFQLDMDPTPEWIGLGTIADQPKVKSNFISTLGYGDPATIFDRSPRPEFDKFNSLI